MLEALIISRDKKIVTPFRVALESAQVKVFVSASADDGIERVAAKKFDAIVVDAGNVVDASEVFMALRKRGSNRTSIVFAVIGGPVQFRDAYEFGANFVLDKPLDPEQIHRIIRAAHGLMVRERRRYHRHSVSDTVAHLVGTDNQELQVDVLNVSEGGMAVRISQRNQFKGSAKVRFFLPDSKVPIRAKGEIVWTRPSGEAGIHFAEIGARSKDELMRWSAERLALLSPGTFLNESRLMVMKPERKAS